MITINHRFILEKYHGLSSRHDCPACGSHHDFSRYIDTETGKYVDPSVGKCNRENSCGYHLTPKQYFDQNPIGSSMIYHQKPPKTIYKQQEHILIPEMLMQRSLVGYKDNTFTQYLSNLFGEPVANELAARYCIGSSHYWQGATIFWFIDSNGGIRAGQVKLFDETGHTIKKHTTWIHHLIREEVPPHWIQSYKDQDVKVSCLFGEHLLNADPQKPVAIVEAPATAITSSFYFPEFIWLATGSLSYLTRERCRALRGRSVVLFPDLGGFDKWTQIAITMKDLFTIKVADFLEKIATSEERKNGLDLRDYLTRYPVEAFRKQQKEIPHPQRTDQLISQSLPKREQSIHHPGKVIKKWDIQSLKDFFPTVDLPKEIMLNPWTKIIDLEMFIASSIETVEANNGKETFLPYLLRLENLKNILLNRIN